MPLSLLNHSALALFAQRTRIPTSARSIGFCAIWVCISSSSSTESKVISFLMRNGNGDHGIIGQRANAVKEVVWLLPSSSLH